LRTPIAALSLQIDNIISYSDDSMRQERQAALATSIRRLQRLVNQLLDLARAQSTGERDEAVVSINDQTRTQIGELYPLIDEKEINLIVSRNEPVTALDNDHQLQHLIRNALSNAIKFSPEHGDIDVQVFAQSGTTVFQVSDEGPGVADEMLDKLRQAFYRPDGQASGQGAGLGLAICHEVAASLGGRLTLSNHHPRGCRFRFEVPVSTMKP
jgi:signal transduction histidine kinase